MTHVLCVAGAVIVGMLAAGIAYRRGLREGVQRGKVLGGE